MARNTRYGVGGKGRGSPKVRGIAIAVVILAVAVIAAYLVVQPGVTEVTATRTVSFQANQTLYFGLSDGTVALKLQSSTPSTAVFYASQTPVLFGSVSQFSLNQGMSANVSSSGSVSADMNIMLISTSATGATVQITPLSTSLGVKPSGSVSVMNPIAFGSNAAAVTTVAASSNTQTGQETSTVSTTVPSTTTANQIASITPAQRAMAAANNSTAGKLMLDFRKLYLADASCDSNTYSITYVKYYSAMPTGPNSFANVSELTPTDVKVSASQTGSSGDYKVTYSMVSQSSVTSGPAVTMTVDPTTGAVSGITYEGMFMGFNYTVASQLYDFQSTIPNSNVCAAYISPP
jgi:hypothetical protein